LGGSSGQRSLVARPVLFQGGSAFHRAQKLGEALGKNFTKVPPADSSAPEFTSPSSKHGEAARKILKRERGEGEGEKTFWEKGKNCTQPRAGTNRLFAYAHFLCGGYRWLVRKSTKGGEKRGDIIAKERTPSIRGRKRNNHQESAFGRLYLLLKLKKTIKKWGFLQAKGRGFARGGERVDENEFGVVHAGREECKPSSQSEYERITHFEKGRSLAGSGGERKT